MSLMTYEDARPWARSVTAKVRTVAVWVDGGAPGGDDVAAPEEPTFRDGWSAALGSSSVNLVRELCSLSHALALDSPDMPAVGVQVEPRTYLTNRLVTSSHFRRERDGSKWSSKPCQP
jgi:hypothetical protein